MYVALHAQQLILHTCASDSVKRSKGFIHEQDGGIGCQRPCQSHSLLLSAGELAWEARTIFSRW